MGDIIPLGKVLRSRIAGDVPFQSRLDGMKNAMQAQSRAAMAAAQQDELKRKARSRDVVVFVGFMWGTIVGLCGVLFPLLWYSIWGY